MPSQTDAFSQTNVSDEQRVAGRDYVELVTPRSLDLLLATTSDHELDEACIGNGRLFGARFGFDAPESARRAILAIRQEYEFTDRQIVQLHRAKVLRIRGLQAKLERSSLLLWGGRLQITVLGIWTVFWLVLVLMQPGFGLKHIAAFTFLGVAFFLIAALTNYGMVQPNRLIDLHKRPLI